VKRYIDGQRALQARLSRGLDGVDRNQRLLWIWDFLSLGICLGWAGRSIEQMTLHEDTIDPWPFADPRVTLRTEGRRLKGRYEDQSQMRAALEDAPWVELTFELYRR
jgi:hypothetical protein